METQEHRMTTASDFADIVWICTSAMSEARRDRLCLAMCEIEACEGNIPSQHWCNECTIKLLVITRLLRLYRRLENL